MTRVIVIGGGASGIAAALSAADLSSAKRSSAGSIPGTSFSSATCVHRRSKKQVSPALSAEI